MRPGNPPAEETSNPADAGPTHWCSPVREQLHARVHCATLDECTITNTPANPAAMILHRYRPCAALKTIDLGIAGVEKCQEIIALLRQLNHARPEPAAEGPAPPRLQTEPYRVGQFGALVRAIEARSPT
jgi:hypothetical protein